MHGVAVHGALHGYTPDVLGVTCPHTSFLGEGHTLCPSSAFYGPGNMGFVYTLTFHHVESHAVTGLTFYHG